MQIIEERVIISNQEFTRSELIEIASFLELDATTSALYLKKEGTTIKVVPILDKAGTVVAEQKREITTVQAIRNSKPIQKALQANLFENSDFSQPIKLKSELNNVILFYRGKSK